MTGPPDPTVQLRPFAGQLRREPPVFELKAGTWQAVAKVTPIVGARGAASDARRFEVSVSWHGPPMHGFPPTPGPVDATDLLMVEELELARTLATLAVEQIRAHKVPDLRALRRGLPGGE